jgi:hypothetical protein
MQTITDKERVRRVVTYVFSKDYDHGRPHSQDHVTNSISHLTGLGYKAAAAIVTAEVERRYPQVKVDNVIDQALNGSLDRSKTDTVRAACDAAGMAFIDIELPRFFRR